MTTVEIGGRRVGDGEPVLVVAEIGANHDRNLDQALALVELASAAGADAVKLQTYTADSLSMRTSHPSARVDPIWGSATLYELYERAAMPYEFHAPIFERARELGMLAFSSPFDEAGVEYLEGLDVPAYKIASPEIVHLPLLRSVAKTGKPVILSTGMAFLGEIEEALETLGAAGAEQIVILQCSSVYPADPGIVNLNVMHALRTQFEVPVGYSDHSLGVGVPIAAAALGACMIEKHFTNDAGRTGPDHRFSLEPADFARMVEGIRQASVAGGVARKDVVPEELTNRSVARRSIFAATDIPRGTTVTADMIRIIRPGSGLHPRFAESLVGRTARRAIERGSPITWDDV